MKKERSFLNKSFGLFVQVALGRMDGKNIKRIDMTEENTLDELISEGDNMYDALKEAVKLISDLADELEYKIEVEG